MADTSIDWADKVWNPVTGCTKVSEGCRNCYAERMAHRWQRAGVRGYEDGFAVTCHPERLSHPRTWRKPRRIFVNSMGDLFHESVPLSFLTEVMQAMDRAKHHTFLVLTKRPEAMRDYLCTVAALGGGEPPAHIWWGVSVEDQQSADERIPLLLLTPAAVRFVSVEPMVGTVDLTRYLGFTGDNGEVGLEERGWGYNSYSGGFIGKGEDDCYDPQCGLDWIICGGETGPDARPLHPDWVRSLRDQCQSAAVPFFFKSWGEWRGDGTDMHRVGKKASGRLLDEMEWLEVPC